MTPKPTIVWFRNDLRLHDNPALQASIDRGGPVVCLYVLESDVDGGRAMGAASLWWLDKSLRRLAEDLSRLDAELILRSGAPTIVLTDLVKETGADAVFWNRRYEKAFMETDKCMKAAFKDQGLTVKSFPGNVLMEPFSITTQDGGPYRVYSPFWRALQKSIDLPAVADAPQALKSIPNLTSECLEDWNLHPATPDWSTGFSKVWSPGEKGARQRLDEFLENAVDTYTDKRDVPSIEATSRLSPHLHFGEVSPRYIWTRVHAAIDAGEIKEKPALKFLSELAWRDFSHHLLYHYPDIDTENYLSKFDAFPWREDDDALLRWRQGLTGYPIVDAGMRELWTTGWMHNRVRMIVASFLTKHLLIHWRAGEEWFWDTLVDADAANNAASWQWVAGSGADAAPYFRIFNPITQGEKFDAEGDYVRRWCPELSKLSDKYIHQPWEAPSSELRRAGVVLGETYPKPIVEHKAARERALTAYDEIKST